MTWFAFRSSRFENTMSSTFRILFMKYSWLGTMSGLVVISFLYKVSKSFLVTSEYLNILKITIVMLSKMSLYIALDVISFLEMMTSFILFTNICTRFTSISFRFVLYSVMILPKVLRIFSDTPWLPTVEQTSLTKRDWDERSLSPQFSKFRSKRSTTSISSFIL